MKHARGRPKATHHNPGGTCNVDMKAHLKGQIASFQAQRENGQKELANIQATMLRLEGAEIAAKNFLARIEREEDEAAKAHAEANGKTEDAGATVP
jgi:hypothetical protein